VCSDKNASDLILVLDYCWGKYLTLFC